MPYYTCVLGDAYGRRTVKRLEVEEQALLVDYLAVALAVATDLEAVTDLQLIRMDLTLSMEQSFDVTAGANVDVGGTFSGYIDGGDGKKASHKVPSIKAALVDPDGSIPIEGAVSDYLDNFLTAGDLMLSDGETISAWISGTLDR